MGYKWYFVRCQSGREDSIRKQLETRINVKGLQDVVPQVLVPFERVTELKGGKRKVVSKKLYPGYLMVQADLGEPEDPRAIEARSTLRETPGFGDFLGTRGEPTPLTENQVSSILARMSDSEERPQVAISLPKYSTASRLPLSWWWTCGSRAVALAPSASRSSSKILR